MRHYRTFQEALNEIRRELKEMGIRVHPKSVQNIDVSENEDYAALELQDYTYRVTQPDYMSLPLNNAQWCEAEFMERVSGRRLNPGTAWKFREKYWAPFINRFGRFDYAYPERMAIPLEHVISALSQDHETRRAFLSVFDRQEDYADEFKRRIPCSLGYQFQFRQGQLNVTYLQRSADFSEHFANDLYMADRLKCFISEKLGMKPGFFTHWVGSLHVFSKDVKGVF